MKKLNLKVTSGILSNSLLGNWFDELEKIHLDYIPEDVDVYLSIHNAAETKLFCKSITDYAPIPAFGASIDNGRKIIIINKGIFESSTEEDLKMLIYHEYAHCIYEHLNKDDGYKESNHRNLSHEIEADIYAIKRMSEETGEYPLNVLDRYLVYIRVVSLEYHKSYLNTMLSMYNLNSIVIKVMTRLALIIPLLDTELSKRYKAVKAALC